MPIDRLNATVRAGDQELGVYKFLDGKNDAVLDFEADCSSGVESTSRKLWVEEV